MIRKYPKIIALFLLISLCFSFTLGCRGTRTPPDNQPPAQGESHTTPPVNQGNNIPASQSKHGNGRYQGQIDSNSIEITLSGVAESDGTRAFQLGDTVKEKFDEYGLKEGDQILFTYTEEDGTRPIITEISK